MTFRGMQGRRNSSSQSGYGWIKFLHLAVYLQNIMHNKIHCKKILPTFKPFFLSNTWHCQKTLLRETLCYQIFQISLTIQFIYPKCEFVKKNIVKQSFQSQSGHGFTTVKMPMLYFVIFLF